MSKTKVSPGMRARLHQYGIDHRDIGRVFNRANAGGTATLPDNIPMPRTSDELADFFGNSANEHRKTVLASNENLTAFIKRYGEQQQSDGTDLHRTVAAETQKALMAYLRDNEQPLNGEGVKRLNLDPQSRPANMLTSHRQATAYNPTALGTKLDSEFKSAAEYFRAAWHLNANPDDQAKMARIRNAFAGVVPADGGFLVPETLRSQLLQIALEMSVVRPRATVVPMESQRVPFPMIDSTTNVGSVFGGMIGYWGEESALLTDSSARFGRALLDAKKLTGYSAVPNELLSDSLISFAALIETLWPQALAFFEDVAFMTGSGAGEPLGFIGANNPAGVAISAEVGQPTATIVLENIINMYSRMLPSSLSRAIWVTTPEALPQLFTMALSVGTGGAPVMLANAAGPAPMTIFGRPLVVCEKASRLGTRGDIAFVDLSYYLVGDRQVMSASSSTDYKFGNDQTAFRIIQRVDGRPWLTSAVTPQNGGPTLSPFVEIATR